MPLTVLLWSTELCLMTSSELFRGLVALWMFPAIHRVRCWWARCPIENTEKGPIRGLVAETSPITKNSQIRFVRLVLSVYAGLTIIFWILKFKITTLDFDKEEQLIYVRQYNIYI